MDKYDKLENWKRNLSRRLEFPVIVKVSESQVGGVIRYRDKLKLINISSVDNLYGVIVEVKVNIR